MIDYFSDRENWPVARTEKVPPVMWTAIVATVPVPSPVRNDPVDAQKEGGVTMATKKSCASSKRTIFLLRSNKWCKAPFARRVCVYLGSNTLDALIP